MVSIVIGGVIGTEVSRRSLRQAVVGATAATMEHIVDAGTVSSRPTLRSNHAVRRVIVPTATTVGPSLMLASNDTDEEYGYHTHHDSIVASALDGSGYVWPRTLLHWR
jgi:hypothetical protein